MRLPRRPGGRHWPSHGSIPHTERRSGIWSHRRCREPMQLVLEQMEINRLRNELKRAVFGRLAAPLVVAVGGHHHDRQIGAALLVLRSLRERAAAHGTGFVRAQRFVIACAMRRGACFQLRALVTEANFLISATSARGASCYAGSSGLRRPKAARAPGNARKRPSPGDRRRDPRRVIRAPLRPGYQPRQSVRLRL